VENAVPASDGSSSKLNVFISYSRHDLASADAIVIALEQQGFEVMIDKRDLPYGEEWQKELADFIRNSDTVVWLVSPDSIASRWCNWEVGEVARLHKRLVTVRIREIDFQSLPDAIGKIHLFPADRTFSISADLETLITTLNADREWLKEGTRLASRARLWQSKRRDNSLLLRGGELSDAERWKNRKPKAAPPVPGDVLELVLESRSALLRRQKWTVVGALTVALISLSLAAVAFYQRNEALVSQSLFLSKLSRDNLESGDSATAVLLALAGLPAWKTAYDRPLVPEAIRSLNDGLFSLREAAVFSGHLADVNTVLFDVTGTLLLTSSDDHTARLWNSHTGALLHILKGHRDKVSQARFSFDGRLIATASEDGTAKIWEATTGRLIRTLVGHAGGVNSVEFDRKASHVVTGSADNTARVWSLIDNSAPIILHGHGPVNSASFSPDGLSVLTASNGDTAALWSSRSGTIIANLTGHTDDVIGGNFDSEGSMVVTFSHDNTARLWDAHTGNPLRTLVHEDWVRSAIFCPTNKCVVTASDDRTARIWDLETDAASIVLPHDDGVRKAAINHRGDMIATAGRDGVMSVWKRQENKQYEKVMRLAGHTAGILDITFDPTDAYVATSSRARNQATGITDGTARMWRIKAPTSAIVSIETSSTVQSLAPSPDGMHLATAQLDGTIAFWNIKESTTISKIKAHEGRIISIGFNADGSKIVTTAEDGTAAIWQAPELSLERRLSRGTHPISDASFNQIGNSVVLGSYDGTVMIWDLASEKLKELEHYSSAVVSVKYSSRSNTVFAAFLDGTVRLWDLDTGRSLKELRAHQGAIRYATFSPKHEWIVMSSEDGRTIVWNTTNAEILDEFHHEGVPIYADFSEDESFIVTAVDQTVAIWKPGSAFPVAIYRGHLGRVNAVRFLRNSRTLVSASSDGTIQVWELRERFSDLLTFARGLSPRCLTVDQMRRFSVPLDASAWCHR
jgi:WD40 repeat protein